MADLGAAFGGFAKGLAGGLQAGEELRLKEQALGLDAQQDTLSSIETLTKVLKVKDPVARRSAMALLMPRMGIDPKSDEGKLLLDTIKSSDEQFLGSMAEALAAFGANTKGKVPLNSLGVLLREKPEEFVKQLITQIETADKRQATRGFLGGGEVSLPGGAGAQPVSQEVPSPLSQAAGIDQVIEELHKARDRAIAQGRMDIAKEFDDRIAASIAARNDMQPELTTQITTANGRRVIVTYDQEGNVKKEVDLGSSTTRFDLGAFRRDLALIANERKDKVQNDSLKDLTKEEALGVLEQLRSPSVLSQLLAFSQAGGIEGAGGADEEAAKGFLEGLFE